MTSMQDVLHMFTGAGTSLKGAKSVVSILEKQGLYPEFRRITGEVNKPVVEVDGKKYLMFSSNNYMSMTENKEVKEAAKKAIDKYGVGPSGSRVISGNLDVIEELEAQLAKLTGTEACLTFPTGYMANVSIFRALMDPFFMNVPVKAEDSIIFSDEYNHGSIVDGIKLSKAKKVVFKHDDLEDLRKKIKENNFKNKLIVTEGVFSLEGEILDLPKYIELAKETGSMLMIDDAHGVGILGDHGGGTPDYYHVEGKVDILMGCMDKAFGGTGGYICGSKTLIDFLKVSARSSLLSSALPSVAAGAMVKATELIYNGKEARDALANKAAYLRRALKEVGFVYYGEANLPALAVHIGDEKKAVDFSRELFKEGVFCVPFRWPAVPLGQARLRISIMADHTYEQLDQFVAACTKVGKKMRVI